jgi:hypothetical protein
MAAAAPTTTSPATPVPPVAKCVNHDVKIGSHTVRYTNYLLDGGLTEVMIDTNLTDNRSILLAS